MLRKTFNYLILGADKKKECQSSFIFAKGPGIFKVDYYLFNGRTESHGIGQMKTSTNITSVAYLLSSISCDDLHFNDFCPIVGNKTFYRNGTKEAVSNEDELLLLKDKYAKMLAEANGIYEKKRSPSSFDIELIASINSDNRFLCTRFLSYCNNSYHYICLLYTSPSPRDATLSRMPSSA